MVRLPAQDEREEAIEVKSIVTVKSIATVVLWQNGVVMAFAPDGTYAMNPKDGPVSAAAIVTLVKDRSSDPEPSWELWLGGCPEPVKLTRQQWIVLERIIGVRPRKERGCSP